MNILVLSCGTGGGHNTAGMAVADEMERRGHTVMFKDAFALVGKPAASIVNNTYIKMVQYAPKAFGVVYSASESTSKKMAGHSAVFYTIGLFKRALKKLLQQNRFDAVVMTHVFAAHMLTSLKRRGIDVPPSYLVMTDYTCHPFSQEADCNYVVTPAKELSPLFTESGIPESKLLPLGIPVKCEFGQPLSKEDACRAVGLDPKPRYILLSGGSIGASSMKPSIRSITVYLKNHTDTHLIIICGSNHHLYEKLRHHFAGHKQLHVIGKTAQMPAFMNVCDVFITKPGGLSTTEAAVSNTPLILMPPIPGCETYNKDFFESHGLALAVKNPKEDLGSALHALENPQVVRQMQQAQRDIINHRTTLDLCDHIESHFS